MSNKTIEYKFQLKKKRFQIYFSSPKCKNWETKKLKIESKINTLWKKSMVSYKKKQLQKLLSRN